MNVLRFDHGETIAMLRESVRDFAAKEIAPRAAQIDRDNQFPDDLIRARVYAYAAPTMIFLIRMCGDPWEMLLV